MTSRRMAFFAIILICSLSAQAQDYAFKVLVNKGKNELKSGSTWQPLKVGTSLKSADELKIAENSYLGLVHVSGKAVEVKKSGNYKVMDLAAHVNGGSSVLNKYTDFILTSNTGPKNKLAATGAVDRGVDNIQVYLPKSEQAVIYNNEVLITWDAAAASGPYVVTFKSLFEDELDVIKTDEPIATIKLDDPNFANEDNILVEVASASNKNKVSDRYTLKKLSKADKERIKNALSEIEDPTSEPTALNKLLIAGFYEQNNLLIDAGTAYLEAIKLAPDVPQYQEAYNDFLLRNALKKPATK